MGKIVSKIRKLLRKGSSYQSELEYLLSHGMKLGQNSTIHAGFQIDSGWPWLISIGDNVTIAPSVTILAHDASTNVVKCCTKLGRVDIGNNVFIGTHSIILCNTRIGDNVVVGAGSLVTKNLPSNGVYAGVPAVRICSIEEYRIKSEALLNSRPRFDDKYDWTQWREAPVEEKERMKKELEDGIGFV
ncbi:MAG: acyltransferase [Ruminococcaceae bacterium]|nr:acyltransferase [Oscillospiraceae bacterium]